MYNFFKPYGGSSLAEVRNLQIFEMLAAPQVALPSEFRNHALAAQHSLPKDWQILIAVPPIEDGRPNWKESLFVFIDAGSDEQLLSIWIMSIEDRLRKEECEGERPFMLVRGHAETFSALRSEGGTDKMSGDANGKALTAYAVVHNAHIERSMAVTIIGPAVQFVEGARFCHFVRKDAPKA